MAAPDRQAGATFGVEEEFFLIDPVDGCPVDRTEEVVAKAGGNVHGGHEDDIGETQYELAPTQVEFASGVCTDLRDLDGRLRDARRRLADAAVQTGARLIASGTPPLAGVVRHTTREARFERIGALYQGLALGYQASGCHVHVGLPDRELAVEVVNHLRPWLPTLLALSVNSPLAEGRDTGYASWRTMETSRFPGAGIPPWFPDASSHEREIDRLVECGVLVDPQMTFWLARPSPHLPTVEVRVADAAGTVEDAVVQAGLTRALVRTALARISAGDEAPRVPDQVAAAAVWSAARYGLDGPAIHPVTERQIDARLLLRELLEHVTPALEECGDRALVTDLLTRIARRGTGAVRQRAAMGVGGIRAAIDFLIDQTAEPLDPASAV